MKFFVLASALAAAIPAALGLTINSPASIVACEPIQLNWSGGQAPYYLSVLPGGQPTAPAYRTLPTQQGTSYTWQVDIPQGVSITIALKDGSGQLAYTSILTISGGATSCNATLAGSGGSSVSGGSSTPSSGSASTSAAAGSASSGATGTSSPGSATSTASSSSASHSSAAGRLGTPAALGVAGVMGLVGAMFF